MAVLSSPFHNRDRERRSLAYSLRSQKAELFILYGRRGMGKSALLRAVLNAEGFPFLYSRLVRRTLPLQLAALQKGLATAKLEGGDPYLFLFSRSGFTPRILDIAKKQNPSRLFLVDLPDLYTI